MYDWLHCNAVALAGVDPHCAPPLDLPPPLSHGPVSAYHVKGRLGVRKCSICMRDMRGPAGVVLDTEANIGHSILEQAFTQSVKRCITKQRQLQ